MPVFCSAQPHRPFSRYAVTERGRADLAYCAIYAGLVRQLSARSEIMYCRESTNIIKSMAARMAVGVRHAERCVRHPLDYPGYPTGFQGRK